MSIPQQPCSISSSSSSSNSISSSRSSSSRSSSTNSSTGSSSSSTLMFQHSPYSKLVQTSLPSPRPHHLECEYGGPPAGRLPMKYLIGLRTCHPQVVVSRPLVVVWNKLTFHSVETEINASRRVNNNTNGFYGHCFSSTTQIE